MKAFNGKTRIKNNLLKLIKEDPSILYFDPYKKDDSNFHIYKKHFINPRYFAIAAAINYRLGTPNDDWFLNLGMLTDLDLVLIDYVEEIKRRYSEIKNNQELMRSLKYVTNPAASDIIAANFVVFATPGARSLKDELDMMTHLKLSLQLETCKVRLY